MTPYVRQCIEKLGISDPGLIDLYRPGLQGSESLGRSIEAAIEPMQIHLQRVGGEEGAIKRARELGVIP